MDTIDETRPLIVSGGEDIFEITDFTVISDFEQFIVTLENAIHEWSLGTSEATGVKRKVSKRFSTDFFHSCNWKNESKFITYPPHSELLLTHVWPEDGSTITMTESNETISEERFPVATNDLLLTESNFYPWSIITQQYGVFEYLLLSPAKDDSNNITSENEAQMILSAIDIATVNSECTLPIFLQFGAPDRIFFIGSVQNGNIRTRFETVHTHHAFSKHKCLSGLADIFKERLNDSTIPALDITVAIELEYIIRNDFDYDNDLHIDEKYIKNLGVSTLPFSTRRDVVKEFRLLTGWPALKQEAITDTINYSDLDPYAAPRWRASVTFHKGVQGLLHSALSKAKEYLKSIDESTVTEKLGPKLTESRSAAEIFRPVVDSGGSGMNINIGAVQLPINDIRLKEIISAIFNVVSETTPSKNHPNEILKDIENTMKSAKAAVSGSIVDNLTKSILLALVQPDSTKNRTLAVCQIWEAFTEKIRSYWEANKDIPGLEDTTVPDLSKCLLHQKLEMIQCCIDSRRKRHELFDQTKNFSTHDDEFYDAPDEFNEETPLTSTETVNYEPEGRLQKSETLKLLNRPEQPLYIPITQDRSPMTEDMLEEHAEYLASMPGDDRVKAQLDTLLSDMQAFKAANPGCCIEDFVRWHSPRDYVEEEDGTGHLSERMDMEDNVWRTTWKEARTVAVAHQNRLFNESKEAEKILHSFMFFKISDIFKMLMPMSLMCAVRRLIEEAEECYPLVQKDLKKLVTHVTRYTHRLSYDECLASLNLIQKVESTIGEYSSLKSKFNFDSSEDKHDIEQLCADNDTIRTFVLDLMSVPPPDQAFANASPELTTAPVTILGAPNGPLAMSIRRLLHKDSSFELEEAEKAEGIEPSTELKFPPITRKHYVLRCTGAREHGSPRILPQRMSASIDGDDFRLCLSLSSDLTFA